METWLILIKSEAVGFSPATHPLYPKQALLALARVIERLARLVGQNDDRASLGVSEPRKRPTASG